VSAACNADNLCQRVVSFKLPATDTAAHAQSMQMQQYSGLILACGPLYC